MMARKIRLKQLSTQAALAYAADRRKNIEILHVPMPNITSSSSTELVRVRKSLRRSILWRGNLV
ncbi:hypothetical protein N8912_03180 [Rhodobacteraceae bacterium]|nr:hypothetical protein [Paracoccaceae bacterium]